MKVVGVDLGHIAPAKRVTGEGDRERASSWERHDLLDHSVEVSLISPVSIDRMKTGGAASRVVRLRQDFQLELGGERLGHLGGRRIAEARGSGMWADL